LKRFLMGFIILAVLITAGAAYSRSSQSPAPEPTQEEQLKQLQTDVYLLGEKYYELEVQMKDMDERLKALEKSHELAIFVEQDMDKRLTEVEGRRR